jgi:hypothetical protein
MQRLHVAQKFYLRQWGNGCPTRVLARKTKFGLSQVMALILSDFVIDLIGPGVDASAQI